MYRTFTANYCESLRGLDRHAVSDEEVIEGTKFFRRSRYRTCSAALALPQALIQGLTDVVLSRPHEENCNKEGKFARLTPGQPAARTHPSFGRPSEDREVLAGVERRVGLLRRFHAKQSPVIIGQRQIRRFLLRRARAAAVVKIQAYLRMWFVGRRAMDQLKNLLRETGELYLTQVGHDGNI